MVFAVLFSTTTGKSDWDRPTHPELAEAATHPPTIRRARLRRMVASIALSSLFVRVPVVETQHHPDRRQDGKHAVERRGRPARLRVVRTRGVEVAIGVVGE